MPKDLFAAEDLRGLLGDLLRDVKPGIPVVVRAELKRDHGDDEDLPIVVYQVSCYQGDKRVSSLVLFADGDGAILSKRANERRRVQLQLAVAVAELLIFQIRNHFHLEVRGEVYSDWLIYEVRVPAGFSVCGKVSCKDFPEQ